jgi:hypothetical protein
MKQIQIVYARANPEGMPIRGARLNPILEFDGKFERRRTAAHEFLFVEVQ